jgi:hypothetical protein
VWVILRRLIPDALELVATNADHWHPDFVMKLWITFNPQLTPVPRRQVFIMLAWETEHAVRSTRSFEAPRYDAASLGNGESLQRQAHDAADANPSVKATRDWQAFPSPMRY